MTFYRRNLPHWQPAGADYFITFGLAGSLPKKAVRKIIQEHKMLLNLLNSENPNRYNINRKRINEKTFRKYEQLLHKEKSGPTWLSNYNVANIVKETIHYRDKKEFNLFAYCVMPNHVHLVFQHLSDAIHQDDNDYPITEIMASLKKYSARQCNKFLKRTGNPFWHAESYDHVIRSKDELQRIIFYTLNNPVKAGLIGHWREWSHSYCSKEFEDLF